MVSSLLIERGFEATEQYRTGTRRVVGNEKIVADCYVHPTADYPQGLIIECKGQDSCGTAHQKLPGLVLDVLGGRYPAPVILLIDGFFYSANPVGISAVKWCRSQVDGQRLKAVMNSQEFLTWLRRKA
jgi:hypothetical protein